MTKHIFFLFLCIISIGAFSQSAPNINWQNTIGGNGDDDTIMIQQTDDGGYILGGGSRSGISGDKTENAIGLYDYWIMKLDVNGNIVWQKTIGGDLDDLPLSIQQTSDEGYIVGGISNSGVSGDKTEDTNGGFDYWIVKLDVNGNIVWQKTIGGTGSENTGKVLQTTDGGYIIAGNSSSDISGDKTENAIGLSDYWILKLDANGNIVWQNTIGGNQEDEALSIQQTSDGGYIVGGASESNISGDKTEASNGGMDYWVVKLDTNGNIVWQNTIGGNNTDYLFSVEETTDNGFILGGYSDSDISGDKTEVSNGDLDYWVVKLDANGNIVWQKTIGGNDTDYLFSAKQTADNGYILTGASKSDISGDKTDACKGDFDIWLVKINETGNIIWQKTIGGSNADYALSAMQTNNNGFIIGGFSNSNISGDKTEDAINNSYDYWIISLDPESASVDELTNKTINIFPNPTDDIIQINYKENVKITIADISGKVVLKTNNKRISLKSLKEGVYFLNLRNLKNEVIANKKIIKQKK